MTAVLPDADTHIAGGPGEEWLRRRAKGIRRQAKPAL